MNKLRAALLPAALAALLAASSGAQAARTPTGLEGHWSGTLLSLADAPTEAELSLDDYGCYAASLKSEHGIETGFYEVKDGRLVLKGTGGAVVRQLELGADKRLHLLDAGGGPLANPPKDCCSLSRD